MPMIIKIALSVVIIGALFALLKKLCNYHSNRQHKKTQLDKLKLAAQAILNADFCLLSSGAGWSADSGLKVFKDFANIDVYKQQKLTYHDLSRADNMEKRPLIAYGFWFHSYNNYKKAFPHNGYYIVKKWKNKYFNSTTVASKRLHGYISNTSVGAFWCHTSNVDHLHEKAGFNPLEIDAIHGDMLNLQCSQRCCRKCWSLDENYYFKINTNKILPLNMDYNTNLFAARFKPLQCRFCHEYAARPAIEMFSDFYFIGRQNRIDNWRNGVIKLCKQQDMKLVIIEIGAGIRIPSIRHHSEGLIQSVKNCTLIRCNPDFPDIPIRYNTVGKGISIKMKAVECIQALDKLLIHFEILHKKNT